MSTPPPFWTVTGGAATVAATGIAVVAVAPANAILGWTLVGLALLAFMLYAGWWLLWVWRGRPDTKRVSDRQAAATVAGDRSIAAVTTGDHSPVTLSGLAETFNSLDPRKSAVNVQAVAGQALLQDIRQAPYPGFFYGYDKIHRPRILDWHRATSEVVAHQYPTTHARYSSALTLPDRDTFWMTHHRTGGHIPRDLRDEAERFVSDRLDELLGLLR